MDLIPIAIGFLAILNGLFTVFWVNRASDKLGATLEGLNDSLAEGIQGLNDQLEPIMTANSRAMGAISSLSDGTKMDNALERRIGLDMMDQAVGENAEILDMIKMAFPRVQEYIDERPEAMVKLLPRIQQLLSDPNARARLNLDGSKGKSNISRIWNE
jgi:hypothetical protein